MKLHNALVYLKAFFVLNIFIGVMGVMFALRGSTVLAAPKGSPWGADYFPNVELIDQNGKTVRFYDDLIKDKVVAINFIYTDCGDTCPAETASLRQVQRLLGDRVGTDIYFYSISVDPSHDTPKVLKEYADKFRVNPGWLFLTGKKEDTQLIRKKLGLFRDEETNKLKEHNTSFMVGNESTGQWMKRSPFDEPKTLARLLGYTLPASNKAIPNASSQKSYAEAKELPKMSKGEDLFRFRCSACHNLGKDSGLGPGLADVTKKREHAWLKRWLKEPDKMLADKDPIAIDLYNRFNKVKMPNLRLTDDDAESLILYLQSVDKAPTHVH